MSNFVFSQFGEFKSEIKRIFEKKLFFAILAAAAFAIGLVLGAVLRPTPFILDYYTDNAENYYAIVMYASSSCFNIFLERILVNLGYFAIFFGLSILPFLFPLNLLIIAYRGFVLSLTVSVFSVHFGLTGVLLACFLILPQNIVTTAALIVCSLLNIGCGKKDKTGIKKFIFYVAILYAVSLLGAVIEILILCLLLRPMNFYF